MYGMRGAFSTCPTGPYSTIRWCVDRYDAAARKFRGTPGDALPWGTKLEHATEDEAVMTSDYPLLPVRRRFWERVLRTIDTTGTVS
ncbi:MAG: hypothetical protein KAY22_27290, partial [Rhizorhabdus sp.]|uniref:hypothetical protein n=1 Tax=Rhizorhabdus sp. TaxID=1968843 RepID=UPI001B42EE7F